MTARNVAPCLCTPWEQSGRRKEIVAVVVGGDGGREAAVITALNSGPSVSPSVPTRKLNRVNCEERQEEEEEEKQLHVSSVNETIRE